MELPFLWNFIFKHSPQDSFTLPESDKEAIKWEARFFWPDKQPIYLQALDPALLNLNLYACKQREDIYYLLPNTSHNLKKRRQTLFYKPHLEQGIIATGFGSKINLDGAKEDLLKDLKNQALNNGLPIAVSKEAYVYKFPSKPTIKLELARLIVKKQVYFSLCIEGRSQHLVEQSFQQLLGNALPCNYVDFLQGLTTT